MVLRMYKKVKNGAKKCEDVWERESNKGKSKERERERDERWR